jgi:hypothetical protein
MTMVLGTVGQYKVNFTRFYCSIEFIVVQRDKINVLLRQVSVKIVGSGLPAGGRVWLTFKRENTNLYDGISPLALPTPSRSTRANDITFANSARTRPP